MAKKKNLLQAMEEDRRNRRTFRQAMAALGELTGRTVREDITSRIFQRFCVGK